MILPIREHKLASGDLLVESRQCDLPLPGWKQPGVAADRRAVPDCGARWLTHSLSRRAFVEAADREVAQAHKQSWPLSLLAIDIDHVKQINDNYGHLSGDFVIRGLARRIRKKCERYELLCRYEGSQFLLLLPESNQQAAQARAEEIRASQRSESFSFEGDQLAVTVTVGVLTFRPKATPFLFCASPRNCAAWQKQGRNRVVS